MLGQARSIPVKAAMAMLGLLEEHYRLPMVPPSAGSRTKISEALGELELAPVGKR